MNFQELVQKCKKLTDTTEFVFLVQTCGKKDSLLYNLLIGPETKINKMNFQDKQNLSIVSIGFKTHETNNLKETNPIYFTTKKTISNAILENIIPEVSNLIFEKKNQNDSPTDINIGNLFISDNLEKFWEIKKKNDKDLVSELT